jgi:hypothetical protein
MSNFAAEMSLAECVAALHAHDVGRVAIVTAAGPRIIPVNYGVLDDGIVFRTSPYSELAQHAIGAELAFEVDDLDFTRHTGWSVVALGVGASVDGDELARVRRVADPDPWAAGARNFYVKVNWRDLSGRRIGAPA